MRSVFNFSLCLVSLVCGLLLSLADYSSAIAQGDPPIVANELSDVEKRQIKIAERFLTVLEKSPRRGTALERVYGHHVEFGTLDDFVKSLKEQTEQAPTDGVAWMLLGLLEAQRGEDAEAIAAFAKAEEHRPEDGLPAYYMGQSLILTGQPELAVAAFERAISREPRRADLLEIFQQLGRVHQRAQRTEEALKVWSRLEAMFPDDVRVQEQIATTLVEEGAYADALPRYEKLSGLVRDDFRKTMFQMEAASLTIRTGERDKGISKYESILSELNPTGWLFRDVRRRIEEVFLRSGDQDGLVAYYQRWLGANPEDVDAMARLAKFLASSARVTEATEWMEKALKLAPTRSALRKSFIDQLVDDQRYEEAIAQYEPLVESAPGNQDFLRDWGRLILKNKKLSPEDRKRQAGKIWDRIVAARPDDALTHAQVADLYRHAEWVDEAMKLYKSAIELAPGDAQYREYLGEYFHILKRSDEAQETWSAIAEGERHTASNVLRLAEVYNSFGYLDQAIEQITEACRLEPKDFTLHEVAAEYHLRAGKYSEALKFIDAAEALVENDEQQASVLKSRIEVFQANRTLSQEVDRLQEELAAVDKPTVMQWHTVARYLEADRRWPDATEAIEKAMAVEPNSVLALTTAARIAEQSGDYSRAANMNRRLAEADRRSRSDHLMNVARLEAQMGRSDEALAAGRDLIVSAPGNTDNYEFYAQLCFQLGKNDEALDTLRKAVRINPTEPHLTMSLGSALSREFRTDEAIQVYWRAFEKSEELDDKTSLTQKLTELYQQLNQFDKLVDRLRRDQREESKRREMTICLAQAHQTAGDFGTARQELESLLSTDTRDTNLLQQLSKLCQASSDTQDAINYQRQLAEIAPGHETEYPLAKMLQSAGDVEAASEIFVRLTRREENPWRLLKSLDSLMKQQSFDSVIAITEPLLSESRDDWELLYREAVAYASQEKIPEAKTRLKRLLALNFPHDQLGIGAKEKLKRQQAKAKSDNLRGIQSQMPTRQSPLSLLSWASQVQQATGLVDNSYYSYQQGLPSFWAPDVYGVARMAAYGWLLKFEDQADDNSKEAESIVDQVSSAADQEGVSRDLIYDWMYVKSLKGDYKTLFRIAKMLAKSGGKEERQYFLSSLRTRGVDANTQSRQNNEKAVETPLADEDLDLMMECYRASKNDSQDNGWAAGGQVIYDPNGQAYVQIGGRWVQIGGSGAASLHQVIKELKLAGRDEQVEALLAEKEAAAKSAGEFAGVMQFYFSNERFDELPKLYAQWSQAAADEIAATPDRPIQNRGRRSGGQRQKHANQLQTVQHFLNQWTGKLGAEEENDRVLEIMDDAFSLLVAEGKKRRAQLASKKRRRSSSHNQGYIPPLQTMYGKKNQNHQVDYPRANTYLDSTGLTLLRQTFEIFKQNELPEELVSHLRKRVEAAPEGSEDLIFERLMLSTVLWWSDEKEDATQVLTSVLKLVPDDPMFRLEVAGLQERLGNFDESLDIIETIKPRDQKLVQQRELRALQLAERLGDIERARAAAERLFGLRLDTATQVKLVDQMRRLGLNELSEAIVSRMQRRSGSDLNSMTSLMALYRGQGKTELAEQIAHRILQRTKSPLSTVTTSGRNPLRRSSRGDANRTQALQVLKQTGALKKITERVESQLERAPDSLRFYAQLIEFYETAGKQTEANTLLEKAVAARPDSMMFRYKFGKSLEATGKPSEACDQYLVILEKRPRWVMDDFYQFQSIFRQADRTVDVLRAVEKMDLKKIGQTYYLTDLVGNMLREQGSQADAATKKIAISLFEKLYDEAPNARANLISNLRDGKLFRNDRIFAVALNSLLPPKNVTLDPWFGLNQVNSYSSNGNANGSFGKIVQGVKGSEKEKELFQAIEAETKSRPNWLGGQAMLAIIDMSSNRKAAAKERMKKIFDDPKVMESISAVPAWLVGQELGKFGDTLELAIKILEQAEARNDQPQMDQLQYSSTAKLIDLYAKAGRREEARRLLVARSRGPGRNYSSNQGYAAYEKLEATTYVAKKLADLGYQVEALIMYRDAFFDKTSMEAAKQYGGDWMTRQLEEGMKETAKAAFDPVNAAKALDQLLSAKTGGGEIDLFINVPSSNKFRDSNVTSQLFQLIDSIGETKNGLASLQTKIAELPKGAADGLSSELIEAHAALKFNPTTAADSIKRLEQWVVGHPLDSIAEGRRPNSRQRAEAANMVRVWVVARTCLASEEHREAGQRLAEVASIAAQRQVEKDWAISILFERGKLAIDQGDAELANRLWSQLLDLVTQRPKRKKNKVGLLPKSNLPTIENRPSPFRMVRFAQESEIVPPLTISQFRSAIELAHVANENAMPELSQRAVMESLRGGLPVPDADFSNPNVPRGVTFNQRNGDSGVNKIESEVAASLLGILSHWNDSDQYPANEIYDLLAPLVFPASRPAEIMLYANSSEIRNARTPSLGATLVTWAAAADRLDELGKLIDSRVAKSGSKNVTANLSGLVMKTKIELQRSDWPAVSDLLNKILEAIGESPSKTNVLLACQAAVPAAKHPQVKNEAMRILRLTFDQQATGNSESFDRLSSMVIAHLAEQNEDKAVSDFFDRFLVNRQKENSRYSGDYGAYAQLRDTATVANEAAKVGAVKTAFDFLGRYADASVSRYGRPDVSLATLGTMLPLRSLPASERYERYAKWSLPAEGRQTVRMVNEWNSSIGHSVPQRFRKRMKDVAATDVVLLSSLIELIDAAEASGKLDELLARAEEALEQNLPNAKGLYTLVLIRKNDFDQARPLVGEFKDTFKERMKRVDNQPRPTVWMDYLLVHQCEQQSADFPSLTKELRKLVKDWALRYGEFMVLARLKQGIARTLARDLQADTLLTDGTILDHWLVLGDPRDSRQSWWLAEGNNLTHLFGPTVEQLCLKYPLTGDFEISFEAFDGAWSESNAGYGGAIVHPNFGGRGFGQVSSIDGMDQVTLANRSPNKRDAFNRFKIQSVDGQMMFHLNDQLFHEETVFSTAPWLMLATRGERTTAYRNFKITGDPQIPREVTLFAQDRMEGWGTPGSRQGQVLHRALARSQEEQSPSISQASTQDQVQVDWQVAEGVLIGKANKDAGSFDPAWTHYARPLLDGETFRYEFFYVPGQSVANPTLGRTAVMIDGGEVQEHWILQPSHDAVLYGVTAENLVTEPEFAVSKSVPLKEQDWNVATVSRRDGKIEVAINEVAVYRCSAADVSDTKFGLFRWKNQSTKVRNATLTGDWPATLTETVSSNLLASGRSYTDAERRIVSEVIDDRFLLSEIDTVLEAAKEVPPSTAYESLREWVLPSVTHDHFRMAYKFDESSKRKPVEASIETSSANDLLCPALELTQVAAAAGKVRDLVSEISALEVSDDTATKNKYAMLALAAIAGDDEQTATEQMQLIFDVMEARGKTTDEASQAAEFLVASQALRIPALHEYVSDYSKRLVGSLSPRASRDFRGAVHRLQADVMAKRLGSQSFAKPLQQWVSLPWEQQSGRQPARWYSASRGSLQSVPGDVGTHLMFQSPLQGNFTVHADIGALSSRSAFLSYGMRGTRLEKNKERVSDMYLFGSPEKSFPDGVKADPSDVYHYRLEVKGSMIRTFVNDTKIQETIIDGVPEPWLILHPQRAGNRASVRNLRIVGTPHIPTEINLSATDLGAWRAGLGQSFTRSLDSQNRGRSRSRSLSAWKKAGDELTGVEIKETGANRAPDSKAATLTYHRPLLEDSEFEFESFYQAGATECHLALGSDVLIVRPDGVKVRSLDKSLNLIQIEQDDAVTLSDEVALNENDWNRYLLRLKGDQVTLIVNGQTVAEHKCSQPIDERQFRFCRFYDYACRIRNITYRGDWSRQLPTVAEQELAYPAGGPFNAADRSVEEKQVFDLSKPLADLEKEGLKVSEPATQLSPQAEGMRFTIKKSKNKNQKPGFIGRQSIAGDFDLVVDIKDLVVDIKDLKVDRVKKGWGAGLEVIVELADAAKSKVTLSIVIDKSGRRYLQASRRHLLPIGKQQKDGFRRYGDENTGKIKLARRGSEIHCMFAATEDDFELIESIVTGAEPVSTFKVQAKSSNPYTKLDLIAKKIELIRYKVSK